MKKTTLLFTALLASAGALPAATILTSGHVDVGIAYDLVDGWNLHVHDEENDLEYAPGDAVLRVGSAAHTIVPGNPSYSFLGTAGSSVWVLPQNENPSLLFLGIGAEEIESGVFQNDLLTLTLRALTGPGHFALYQTDAFGEPTVFMNSRDGLSLLDRFDATAGSHAHFNWAFSEPGTYSMAFEASGQLVGGGSTFSGPLTYTFDVQAVPEPGTYALIGLGLLTFFMIQRRRPN